MQTASLIKEVFTNPKNINEIFSQYFEEKNHKFRPLEEIYETEKLTDRFEEPVLIGELELEDSYQLDFFTIKTKENLSERSSKRQQYEIAKDLLKLRNKDAGIFIFYDEEGNFRFSFVFAEYQGKKRDFSHYKRYTYFVSKDQPNRTFIERLDLAKFLSLDEIKEAFSVEPLRDEFFDEYLLIFNKLWENILKQLKGKYEDYLYKSKEAAHQILNRLIFIYFIQRKKEWFPNIPNQKTLINYFWEEYNKTSSEKNTFFTKWLKILFLYGFNKKYAEIEANPELRELPKHIKDIIALLPYLNGGLFAENEIDKLDIFISDELMKEIFEFLNRYNFTIVESLGFDKEVAVNPELIGTIYEKFVNLETTPELKEKYEAEGKTKGIIYTQEIEIDFMVKKAFIHYLQNNSNLSLQRIYNFIFDDIEDFEISSPEEYETLKNLVENVKIVDPACGSGSFLIGIVNLLHDLHKKLLKYSPEENPKEYAIRKHIIEENVYGVDVQDWAVKIAELRLWLFLIVESDLKREEILFEPLLPNLSFKVRQGDSLIEEIGNIDMSFLRKDLKQIPPKIKTKITQLKKEKLKYTKNEKGHLSAKEIEKLELDIYRDLLEEKIKYLIEETKKLRNSITKSIQSNELFKETSDKNKEIFEKQKKEIEKNIHQIEKEIEILKELKNNLKENKPFVWDIDFAEVFLDENKKGFDIVIGNPPYVRQEKIAPPLLNERDFKPEQWGKLKKNYKEKLQKMVENLYGKPFKPDGKADLYVYFYFKSLSLLNPKGTFAFITSNSWLDVEFGKSLQEFLLRKVKIYSINDNKSKRSFKEADVNTIIIFTSSVSNKEIENFENIAKFVMWKKPFEEVINKENLFRIDNIGIKVENKPLTELTENIVDTEDYRVFPIKQKNLYCDAISVERGSKNLIKDCTKQTYEGNKWGGKFLRAPDIFFTILKKGKDKLVRLGDIAEVKAGIITGNNKNYYFPRPEMFDEREFSLVFKSPREVNKILLTKDDAVSIIKAKNVPFQIRRAPLLWVDLRGNKHLVHINQDNLPFEHNFYGIFPKNLDAIKLALILNSSLEWFFIEIFGRRGLGGGALRLVKEDILKLPLIFLKNIQILSSTKNSFLKRKQNDVFTELGFDPNKPIREQEPNPLPDRKALDDIIFNELGLTEEEIKEVYWAVAELVKNRLDKARSV